MNKQTNLSRCEWSCGDPLYEQYHDRQWGTPEYDERILFEFLVLEGAQAGLSWITVLRKRENYREAFDGFNPEKMARYSEKKKQRLLNDRGIIRNRLKIDSAINNAQQFLRFNEQGESFSDFLWSFVNHQPVQNHFERLDQIPSATVVSEAMSKALKKRGFNFIGGTICYAFMQATGMVNDHLTSCYRHRECQEWGQ